MNDQNEGSVAEDHLTIGRTIRRNAERSPARPAVLSSTLAPITYRELHCQLDAVRARLGHAGLDRNARIGVLMPSGPNVVIAIVAVACCSVAVPLDLRLTFEEVKQRLKVLGLSAVLVEEGCTSEGRRAAEHHNVTIIEVAPAGGGKLGLQLAVPYSGSRAFPDDPDPDAPAFILQTSGTTAKPKLIPFTHRNLLAAAARLQAWFRLTPEDRCLSVSPPHYSHGLKVTVF